MLRNLGFWLSKQANFPFCSPDTLQLSLTNLCNLKCKMCSVWSNYNAAEELSFAEISAVIDQAAQWGIKEVNLCGGEPLLSRDCFKIIGKAKSRGMKVILTTNGTLIDQPMAAALAGSGVDIICISLDGATSSVHDGIRGVKGAYESILRGINALNQEGQSGKPVKVLILTLHNDNLDEALDYILLAKGLKVDAVYLTSLVSDNINLSSSNPRNPLWITGERLNKLDQVVDNLSALQAKYYKFDYPSFPLIKRYFRGELKRGDWVCFAGYRRFVVCPDGNIQMCGEIIGNIRQEKNIRKIWASLPAGLKRRKIRSCRNFCLQDCHARRESASLKDIWSTFCNQTKQ